MSPEDINTLRLEVKKLIAENDLDIRGGRSRLLAALAKKMGRPVNAKSLTMSLTGYRTGTASIDLLSNLKEILTGDFIHALEDSDK